MWARASDVCIAASHQPHDTRHEYRVATPLLDLAGAQEPRQPIGASVPRRPGHVLRTAGYSALRTVVNRAGFSGDGLGIRRT